MRRAVRWIKKVVTGDRSVESDEQKRIAILMERTPHGDDTINPGQ